MIAGDANDAAVRDYLDALLQEPAPQPAAAEPETTWQSCRLGRLQLLLPADSVGAPIDAGDAAHPVRHLAHVRIGADDWRVLDLAHCIAPNLAAAAADTLLPVVGSHWLLAVSGCPVTLQLPDDAIAWRANRQSRPWLAGMSRDGRHMALDVRVLVAQVGDSADIHPKETPA